MNCQNDDRRQPRRSTKFFLSIPWGSVACPMSFDFTFEFLFGVYLALCNPVARSSWRFLPVSDLWLANSLALVHPTALNSMDLPRQLLIPLGQMTNSPWCYSGELTPHLARDSTIERCQSMACWRRPRCSTISPLFQAMLEILRRRRFQC